MAGIPSSAGIPLTPHNPTNRVACRKAYQRSKSKPQSLAHAKHFSTGFLLTQSPREFDVTSANQSHNQGLECWRSSEAYGVTLSCIFIVLVLTQNIQTNLSELNRIDIKIDRDCLLSIYTLYQSWPLRLNLQFCSVCLKRPVVGVHLDKPIGIALTLQLCTLCSTVWFIVQQALYHIVLISVN